MSLCLAGAGFTLADTPAPTTQQLIEKLSSESYQERQDAMDALWKIGKPALPSLEKSIRAADPELAARARVLARNIHAGILPETPKEIADLVEKYNRVRDLNEKRNIMNKLRELEAYKQMLFMLSWEEDPDIKRGLHEELVSISLLAARQALTSDHLDEAIALLRESHQQGVNAAAFAHLLYHSGKIDEELAAQMALPLAKQSREWQLQLLLTKGDKKRARALAQSINHRKTIAILDLLDGDARGIMNFLAENTAEKLPDGLTDHLIRYCLGKSNGNAAQFAEKMMHFAIDTTKETEATQVQRGLFLSGHPDKGANLLTQRSPMDGFLFYSNSDQSEPALAALGIPAPHQNYDQYLAWVKKTTEKAVDDDDEDNQASREQELLVVASFFHNRGNDDIAKATLKPLLDFYIKDGADRWFDIITIVAQEGMPELAFAFALERGDEDNTFEKIIEKLFNDATEPTIVWEELGSRYPNDKRRQFTEMGILLGVWQDKHEVAKDLSLSLLQDAEKKGNASRMAMLESLSAVAMSGFNYLSAYQYLKELKPRDGKQADNSNNSQRCRILAEVLMDWPEIIKMYQAKQDALTKSPSGMVKYAIALRKVGQNQEAEKWLKRAITLTLGNRYELAEIATMLHMAEYPEEATAIFHQLMLAISSDDEAVNNTLLFLVNQLNDSTAYYLKNQLWQQAAAMYAAEAMALLCSDSQRNVNPAYLHRVAFNVSYCNGMLALERGQKQPAINLLTQAHGMMAGNGYLADYFFPSLRSSGLSKEYDAWFEESWQTLIKETKLYPKSHNTLNTLAWLGARSVRKLDESQKHIEQALEIQPRQGAYLDTLAEVHFAQGNRELAIKHSQQAIQHLVDGSLAFRYFNAGALINTYWELNFQLKRFSEDPFPTAKVQPMRKRSSSQN